MVTPTSSVCRLATTVGGMRRILKKKESALEYIRKAVESGVYRTPQEINAIVASRRESDDLKVIMKRFRQDVVRGSHVNDYPDHYIIMRQNPPIPVPLRIPVKMLRQMRHDHAVQHHKKSKPVETLVKKYMDIFEHQSLHSDNTTGFDESNRVAGQQKKPSLSSNEFYSRLLGVQASASSSPHLSSSHVLFNQSATIQLAYDAAVHHYRLQRSDDTLSESDCMKQVEEILKQQYKNEEVLSKKNRISAHSLHQLKKDLKKEKENSSSPPTSDMKNTEIMAMMSWSDRLNAVPYNEWTVGASTALDHWIARKILKISEETWQACLEGSSVSPHFLAVGREIVATREILFPETVSSHEARLQNESDLIEDADITPELDDNEDDIDNILALLGDLRILNMGNTEKSSERGKFDFESSMENKSSTTFLTKRDLDHDALTEELVSELQVWRRKVHGIDQLHPYETWSSETQREFDAWLQRYVSTVLLNSPNATLSSIDYSSTREALLSQPPLDKEESDAFWGSLSEPQLARELVQRLKANISNSKEAQAKLHILDGIMGIGRIWDSLTVDQQVARLLNLGTIRPLLDEYTNEKDRNKFLSRYGYQLLHGIPLEHIVSDPNGPISFSDLPLNVASALNVDASNRFSLQVKPFNALAEADKLKDNNDTRRDEVIMTADAKSRLLYMIWNRQKAGRARYEERLFQDSRLGLKYDKTGKRKRNKRSTKDDSY